MKAKRIGGHIHGLRLSVESAMTLRQHTQLHLYWLHKRFFRLLLFRRRFRGKSDTKNTFTWVLVLQHMDIGQSGDCCAINHINIMNNLEPRDDFSKSRNKMKWPNFHCVSHRRRFYGWYTHRHTFRPPLLREHAWHKTWLPRKICVRFVSVRIKTVHTLWRTLYCVCVCVVCWFRFGHNIIIVHLLWPL